MSRVAARLTGITKRFAAQRALDGASLAVPAGEVHGVLGENGAGKSTLLGVLGGMVRPDAGSVEIAGSPVTLSSPRDAWALGVGMVHQHFTLVPRLSVLENLALGLRVGSGARLPQGAARRAAGELFDRTGLHVPLEAPVEALGVGDRQRVEILKALLKEPELLILDEPTAVLTPGEVARLFRLLRELAAEGRTVVLVAHKLDEMLAVADRVTVLRGGRTVLEAPRSEVDARSLVAAMVGTGTVDPLAVGSPETAELRRRRSRSSGEPVVTLDAVRARGMRGEWAVDGVSLTVGRGEIVGIAGVEGNGQRQLSEVLAGCAVPLEGRVSLPGAIGFVPQDRATAGLVADFDLVENVALAHARGPGWSLPWRRLRERTEALLREHDVRAAGPGAPARTLSGGNQQRLIVARELERAGDLLVAENPTRGLDVGASAFVHAELERILTRPGPPGVVLLSTDLDEVLALADRLFVMVRGRLIPVPGDQRDRGAVGSLMLAGGDAAA